MKTRTKKRTPRPGQTNVTCYLTDSEQARVRLLACAHGLPVSGVVRTTMVTGLPAIEQHDPVPPLDNGEEVRLDDTEVRVNTDDHQEEANGP